MKKICKNCGISKDIHDFYKCKKMKDGHFNSCKECYKKSVLKNRVAHIEYYREYDRRRGNRQTKEYLSEYRKKFPLKYKATRMVSNAIRDKKLFKMPCEICGADKRTHAHHDDYSKPLNVRWLCAAHHRQWHVENGEAENAT